MQEGNMMGTARQKQVRSFACGLLSGVFFITAVVISRRISGDAGPFSSEAFACLTGAVASIIGFLCGSQAGLAGKTLPIPQRSMLISLCGLPGVMLGLAVLPSESSTGMTFLLGLYLSGVLTVNSLEAGDLDFGIALPFIEREGRRRTAERASVTEAPRDSSPPAQTVDPQNASEEAAIKADSQNSTECSENTLDTEHDLSLDQRLASLAISSNESRHDATPLEETALSFETQASIPHPGSRPETTQWMSRSMVDGTDLAEGAFRVHFTAGQRLAPVHLPFSPPLSDTPEFECEPADDSDLRFRTTALHAYGIRIEVSRSGDCHEAEVVEVAWSASAPLKESLAA